MRQIRLEGVLAQSLSHTQNHLQFVGHRFIVNEFSQHLIVGLLLLRVTFAVHSAQCRTHNTAKRKSGRQAQNLYQDPGWSSLSTDYTNAAI